MFDLYALILTFVHSLCRYEFFLQLKQDIQMGRLECPFETAVELGSYALQCEYLSTRQGALILGSPPPPLSNREFEFKK